MAIIGLTPRRSVNLPGSSLARMLGCVLTGRVQTGPAIEKFYQQFSEYIGAEHVIGAASGRSAFMLAVQALGLEPGAEIIFPDFTFPVIPLVAEQLGYKPVFCDVDPKTFNAGPEHFEPLMNERTGAILATHMFGQPCAIESLVELAHRRGIKVLEDCAHSLGARVNGKLTGTFGDIGVFSFAVGKNMPCCGGGAIVTNNTEMADRARKLMESAPLAPYKMLVKTGLSVWVTWLVTRPWLYGLTVYQLVRMKQRAGKPLLDSAVKDELLDLFSQHPPSLKQFGNLQAAVGLMQLQRIEDYNTRTRQNARVLTEALQGVEGVQLPISPDDEHVYVYYSVLMNPEIRQRVRESLLVNGFDTKTSDMAACTGLKHFADPVRPACPASAPLEPGILELPVNPALNTPKMWKLGATLRQALQE